MISRIDSANARFSKGFNCSQTVFATYSDLLGIDEITALRVSGAFGGGMGRLGEACGALTGAFMLIGSKFAMTSEGDNKAKDLTYKMVREFTERFKKLHSHVACRDLLGVDISTPEGFAQVKEKNLHVCKCSVFVKDACKLVEEMLFSTETGY
ncbi:MAG TPA: C-GCAxxG-C-C family protein [Candidatus Wallbacteria bacterium]|nr:C-GCAxxG-C-C family protein [Candidatus Wallbacteria bacterium]